MIRAALALALLVAHGAAAQEEPAALPDGPGRDETFYACTACHSTAIIRRSALSRDRWDGLLDWMTSTHGMVPLDPADRTVVVDYLAAQFGPRQRGPRNPFLPN